MNESKLKYFGIGLCFILLFIVVFGSDLVTLYKEIVEITAETSLVIPNVEIISVEIKGAVHRPGVYELSDGSTLYELTLLAKLKDDANIVDVNLAEKLKANASYYIPYNSNTSISEALSDNKININTASFAQLDSLDGIGTAKANKILSYINSGNKITTYEELVSIVGGLNAEDLEAIKAKTVLE